MTPLVGLFAGLLAGVLLGWAIRLVTYRGIPQKRHDEVQIELHAAQQSLTRAETEASGLRERQDKAEKALTAERERVTALTSERSQLVERNKYLNIQVTEEREALEKRIEAQRAELAEMKKALGEQFENLANRIFDEKSERFSKLNLERLKPLLDPLRENIDSFRRKVESVHETSIKQNTSLIDEIKRLQSLNQQISTDATNLTKALKGDVKVMGNWGEMVLERILEMSGLRKDIEYHTQGKGLDLESAPGKSKPRPDVVVHLPDSRHIVVDSKVSLVAYERLIAAETEEERNAAERELTASIRAHINDLHSKHYSAVRGMNSPDFVFLFMYIEAGFIHAMRSDDELYQHGLDKNVLVVGPSALLATLRTIAYVWRQENQAKNVLEIARQGAALYDKFVGFSEDLLEIRKHLGKTDEAFESALNKLHTGKGNLVGRVERLKKLGVKTTKEIATALLPESDIIDDETTEQLTIEEHDES
ncbi:MAG: DNA recombination protein RmuC [Candidatus Cloacimonetes bacterium]|nr:DNA recombination protein RmuC [Candidatus Cloacimonadota bacterium]